MGTGRKRLVTFGCSLTAGTGLSETTSAWPYVLGRLMNRSVINKGFPGGSNIEILRNILSFNYHKDDLVVIGWTYCHRDTVFNALSADIRTSSDSDLFTKWIAVHSNYDNNVRSGIYIQHAELYLHSLSIDFYNFWAPPMPNLLIDRLLDSTIGQYMGCLPKLMNKNALYTNILHMEDYATDGNHPGPISHAKAATTLARIISEK